MVLPVQSLREIGASASFLVSHVSERRLFGSGGGTRTPDTRIMILFKSMSSSGDSKKAPKPAGNMLTDPWLRVGYEAFRIDWP